MVVVVVARLPWKLICFPEFLNLIFLRSHYRENIKMPQKIYLLLFIAYQLWPMSSWWILDTVWWMKQMKQLSDQSRLRIPLLTCTYCSNGCYNWLFFFFLNSSNFVLSFTTCYGYSCLIQYLLYPVPNCLDLQFLIVDFVTVYLIEEFTANLVWHRNSSYCHAIDCLICQLQFLTDF